MEGIGLAGREAGLNAMTTRLKRHAQLALTNAGAHSPESP
jgi:hypothetical protein